MTMWIIIIVVVAIAYLIYRYNKKPNKSGSAGGRPRNTRNQ